MTRLHLVGLCHLLTAAEGFEIPAADDSYLGFAGGGHRAQLLTIGALRGLALLEADELATRDSTVYKPHYYGAVSGSTWSMLPYVMARRENCNAPVSQHRMEELIWDRYIDVFGLLPRTDAAKNTEALVRHMQTLRALDRAGVDGEIDQVLLWRTGIFNGKKPDIVKDAIGVRRWREYQDHWRTWVEANVAHGADWSSENHTKCKDACPVLVALIENNSTLNRTDAEYDPMEAGDMYETADSDCWNGDMTWPTMSWAYASAESSNALGTKDTTKGFPPLPGMNDREVFDNANRTVVDGGKLDTFALFPALQKQVKRVVIWSDAGNDYQVSYWKDLVDMMRNESNWLVLPNTTRYRAFEELVAQCMMPHLPALFGIYVHDMIPAHKSDFRKQTMWRWRNQVFERQAFRGLVEALYNSMLSGDGAVATVALRTIRNPYMGIAPYSLVFTFMSVGAMPKWQSTLLAAGIDPKRECKRFNSNSLPFKLKYLLEHLVGFGETFPFLDMGVQISKTCSSLMAHLATFLVLNNREHFSFDLGLPADGAGPYGPCSTDESFRGFRNCLDASAGTEGFTGFLRGELDGRPEDLREELVDDLSAGLLYSVMAASQFSLSDLAQLPDAELELIV